MRNNSIPTLCDEIGRPSRLLEHNLTELREKVESIAKEAEHYGMNEKKYCKMTLRELMAEISRRKALNEEKRIHNPV